MHADGSIVYGYTSKNLDDQNLAVSSLLWCCLLNSVREKLARKVQYLQNKSTSSVSSPICKP